MKMHILYLPIAKILCDCISNENNHKELFLCLDNNKMCNYPDIQVTNIFIFSYLTI